MTKLRVKTTVAAAIAGIGEVLGRAVVMKRLGHFNSFDAWTPESKSVDDGVGGAWLEAGLVKLSGHGVYAHGGVSCTINSLRSLASPPARPAADNRHNRASHRGGCSSIWGSPAWLEADHGC